MRSSAAQSAARSLVGAPAPSSDLAVLAAGVVAALGASIPLARGDARPATIPVSEIKEGMKGYGLTVFKGTQPERFDVEVIGVLHHFRPGEELVVIRTPNPRLDVTKAVRGMSGSPIYLDGRLAGAYAYSLAAFEIEPVAGVTPIDLMLTEMRRPIPPGFWPLEGAAPLPAGRRAAAAAPAAHASATRFEGAPGTYDLREHASQLAGRANGSAGPAVPGRGEPRRDDAGVDASHAVGRRRQVGGGLPQARRAARSRAAAGRRRQRQRPLGAGALRQRRRPRRGARAR